MRNVKTNCTVFAVNQQEIAITNFDENVTRTLTDNNIELYSKKNNGMVLQFVLIYQPVCP
jgi:hypothetical protein